MNELKKALSVIIPWLEKQGIPYMVFGGIAVGVYGTQRQTFDIDIKVSVDQKEIQTFISKLNSVAVVVPKDPFSFIDETHVLPVDVEDVRVDFVFADLPFEKEAIGRAVKVTVYGIEAQVVSPEDLIIHKSISTREKDWIDIKDIAQKTSSQLDWEYILQHCRQLADFMKQPGILARIEAAKNEE